MHKAAGMEYSTFIFIFISPNSSEKMNNKQQNKQNKKLNLWAARLLRQLSTSKNASIDAGVTGVN